MSTQPSAPEGTAPYGTGAQAAPQRRIRVPHLQQMKERGEKWVMLTAYDMYTAEIFDEAGIPALLVGDSAGNNVYGFETTVPVTVEGAAYSVSAKSLTLAGGGSVTIRITVDPAKLVAGPNPGTLRLGGAAHAVVFAWGK